MPVVHVQAWKSDGALHAESNKVNKGFGLLEWTGAIIPQGLLVKGTFALNYLSKPLCASTAAEKWLQVPRVAGTLRGGL